MAQGPVSAVAHHAAGEEGRIVEDRAVGVQQGVAEFAAFVDGPRRFRRGMAGDPAREGKLAEQPGKTFFVLLYVGVQLRVSAFEISVGHHPRPAMARAAYVNRVEAMEPYRTIHVRVNKIQAWRGSPMAQ